MKFTTSLAIESWVLYALGVFVVACRMASRKIKLGKWRCIQVDDYLMLFALSMFTGVTVSINKVAENGSNYMPQEVAEALTPEGVRQAVYGSIMTFVLEIFTLTALWIIKFCLLILYHRLTHGTKSLQAWGVKVVAAYCALTYVATMALFLFYWCHPTHEYWAVPVKNEQCASYYHHLIFATACNISSDILLFFIPIPIIIRTRLPMRRKIILCCILGLGVFNILASVLNRCYNFSNPNSYVFLYWYVAEVGIAMCVGNLPLCWPLVRVVLGRKVDSGAQSYENQPSNERDKGNKKPRSYGDTWAMMTDEDDIGWRGVTPRPGSYQGSEIELVNCSNAAGPSHLFPTNVEASASYDGGVQAISKDDEIRVVTTVDVSSQHHGAEQLIDQSSQPEASDKAIP